MKSKLQEVIGEELTNILIEASQALALEAAEEEPPLLVCSPKQRAAQLHAESMDAFEQMATLYSEGTALMLEALKKLSGSRSDIDCESVVHELEEAGAVAGKGAGGLEVIAISPKTIDALYSAARTILTEKRYFDAVKVFSLLCTIAPGRYYHWVGLGHSLFQDHKFDKAILAYYQASSLDPVNPWPMIWAANACEELDEKAAAFDLFKRAQELIPEAHDEKLNSLLPVIEKRLKAFSHQL